MDGRSAGPQTPEGTGALEEETRFGAYSVVLKKAKGLNAVLRAGLGLKANDLYLEVHVPDPVRGTPGSILKAFKEGAMEMADFLSERHINPRWLIGITHENVARPAQRFLNFQVITGIPDDAVDREKSDRVAMGYSNTKRWEGGAPQGPLCLCYQSFAAFMDYAERLRRKRSAGVGSAGR